MCLFESLHKSYISNLDRFCFSINDSMFFVVFAIPFDVITCQLLEKNAIQLIPRAHESVIRNRMHI